jgi:hypothetical protein
MLVHVLVCVCVRARARARITYCTYEWKWVTQAVCVGSETIQRISTAFGNGDLFQDLLSVFRCGLYWFT